MFRLFMKIALLFCISVPMWAGGVYSNVYTYGDSKTNYGVLAIGSYKSNVIDTVTISNTNFLRTYGFLTVWSEKIKVDFPYLAVKTGNYNISVYKWNIVTNTNITTTYATNTYISTVQANTAIITNILFNKTNIISNYVVDTWSNTNVYYSEFLFSYTSSLFKRYFVSVNTNVSYSSRYTRLYTISDQVSNYNIKIVNNVPVIAYNPISTPLRVKYNINSITSNYFYGHGVSSDIFIDYIGNSFYFAYAGGTCIEVIKVSNNSGTVYSNVSYPRTADFINVSNNILYSYAISNYIYLSSFNLSNNSFALIASNNINSVSNISMREQDGSIFISYIGTNLKSTVLIYSNGILTNFNTFNLATAASGTLLSKTINGLVNLIYSMSNLYIFNVGDIVTNTPSSSSSSSSLVSSSSSSLVSSASSSSLISSSSSLSSSSSSSLISSSSSSLVSSSSSSASSDGVYTHVGMTGTVTINTTGTTNLIYDFGTNHVQGDSVFISWWRQGTNWTTTVKTNGTYLARTEFGGSYGDPLAGTTPRPVLNTNSIGWYTNFAWTNSSNVLISYESNIYIGFTNLISNVFVNTDTYSIMTDYMDTNLSNVNYTWYGTKPIGESIRMAYWYLGTNYTSWVTTNTYLHLSNGVVDGASNGISLTTNTNGWYSNLNYNFAIVATNLVMSNTVTTNLTLSNDGTSNYIVFTFASNVVKSTAATTGGYAGFTKYFSWWYKGTNWKYTSVREDVYNNNFQFWDASNLIAANSNTYPVVQQGYTNPLHNYSAGQNNNTMWYSTLMSNVNERISNLSVKLPVAPDAGSNFTMSFILYYSNYVLATNFRDIGSNVQIIWSNNNTLTTSNMTILSTTNFIITNSTTNNSLKATYKGKTNAITYGVSLDTVASISNNGDMIAKNYYEYPITAYVVLSNTITNNVTVNSVAAFASSNTTSIYEITVPWKNIIAINFHSVTNGMHKIANTNISEYSINGVQPNKLSRYSVPWDEFEAQSGGYPIIMSHMIFLTYTNNLTNDNIYSIVTPYGTTNFTYSDVVTRSDSVKVNQEGYASNATRYANFGIFLGDGGSISNLGAPLSYGVFIESNTNLVLSNVGVFLIDDTAVYNYTTNSTNAISASGEYVYRCDMTAVPVGGPYFIKVYGVGRSFSFGIGRSYVSNIAYIYERGLYHQRCGCSLDTNYTAFSRSNCRMHTNIAFVEFPFSETGFITNVLNSTNTTNYVYGGYHDAGDFDRRPYHVIIPELMLGYYEAFTTNFKDSQYNLPESGDGIPDFLNEAVWGMKIWEFMQKSDGGVMAGTETTRHPDYGQCTAATEYTNTDGTVRYYGTWGVSQDVTMSACGQFALAARLLRPYGETNWTNYINRAKRSWGWMLTNVFYLTNRASAITNTNWTKLMYAAEQLYLSTATGNPAIDATNEYHLVFKTCASNIFITSTAGWPDQYYHDNMSANTKTVHFSSYILTTNQVDTAIVAVLRGRILTAASNGGYHENPTNNPYMQCAIKFVGWGAMTAGGRYADAYAFAYRITTNQLWYSLASQIADYNLGLNPASIVYTTGLGKRTVQSALQLDSWATKYGKFEHDGVPIGNVPGITVYGPAEARSMMAYQAVANTKIFPAWYNEPVQRRFTDTWSTIGTGEFSTWETIIFNACLYGFLYNANEQ